MRNAFIRTLTELAAADKDVFLITGDLGFSVFEDFRARFPGQFFNAGLCEQNMVGLAAGLAMEGKRVFVYSIIPFLAYRALEQIRNDLCYQKVPVTLIGVGSGFCYGPLGGTHHAIADAAVMTSLPGINVYSPAGPAETDIVIRHAVCSEVPNYVRLNRAGDPEVHPAPAAVAAKFAIGAPVHVKGEGKAVVIFSTGSVTTVAADAVDQLNAEGIPASLYSCPTLKPMNAPVFLDIINAAEAVVTVEELVERNGLGAAVSRMMAAGGAQKKILMFSLPDSFTHKVGSQAYLREHYGLTKANIVTQVQQKCKELIRR